MYNKTLALIAIVLIGALAQAQAQEQPAVIPLGILASCSEKSVAMNLVDKWEELPFVSAQANSQLFPQGNRLGGKFKMYVNPETWSFSVFLTDPDETLWCLLTTGNELAVGEGDTI